MVQYLSVGHPQKTTKMSTKLFARKPILHLRMHPRQCRVTTDVHVFIDMV
jgi:hypothetical protein